MFPITERVLLGLGLALPSVFSGGVVWMYWGEGNLFTDGVVVLFAVLSLVALVVLATRRVATPGANSVRPPRREVAVDP
jgi:hypothetical protein